MSVPVVFSEDYGLRLTVNIGGVNVVTLNKRGRFSAEDYEAIFVSLGGN